jgi:hypothetical protein
VLPLLAPALFLVPGSLLPSGQSYSQPLPFSPLFRKAKLSHANATPRAKNPTLSPQRRLFLFGIAWPPNPSSVAAIARRRASSVAGSERGPSVSGGSRRRRGTAGVITPLEGRRSSLPASVSSPPAAHLGRYAFVQWVRAFAFCCVLFVVRTAEWGFSRCGFSDPVSENSDVFCCFGCD